MQKNFPEPPSARPVTLLALSALFENFAGLDHLKPYGMPGDFPKLPKTSDFGAVISTRRPR
jgi:hypothetical protein